MINRKQVPFVLLCALLIIVPRDEAESSEVKCLEEGVSEITAINRINASSFSYSVLGSRKTMHFPSDCGVSYSDRIFGGYATDLDEHPWLGLLQYKYPGEDNFRTECGSVLIGDRYALTAAHCVMENGPPVRVLFGEHDLDNATDCQTTQSGKKDCADSPLSVKIDRIFVPDSRCQDESFYEDIALIRLQEPVPFSAFVKPICLPSPDAGISNHERFVGAGWGYTEKGIKSNVKLAVELPIRAREDCNSNIPLNEGQFCLGGEIGSDTCIGDSGGPITYIDPETGRWTLVGLVSMGPDPCGQENEPSVNTYIPKYLDWIFQAMND